jgi:chromosome segregation ATPase
VSDKNISNLEQEVQELKRQIQTLTWDLEASRNNCSRKNERIRHLIRLGLETSECGLQTHREMWEREEEL